MAHVITTDGGEHLSVDQPRPTSAPVAPAPVVDLAADEREILAQAAAILRARVERLDAASEAAEAKAHEADAMFFESRSRECERSAKTIELELAALPLKGGR